MSELKLEFVGKQVKDMYGTLMGTVIGILTDTDGSIESVSVDCGDSGLKPLPYEQLLVQGNYVIFIPRWRLDAQKLFRQKNLTLKRIKALQQLVEEDDSMKDDAEIVYSKYEKKLKDLEDKEKSIKQKLIERITELDKLTKDIKSILFDSKLQYKSHEITEETYLQVTQYTKELMDHINLEREEISNIKIRLEEQNLENTLPPPTLPQKNEIEKKKSDELLTENTMDNNTNLDKNVDSVNPESSTTTQTIENISYSVNPESSTTTQTIENNQDTNLDTNKEIEQYKESSTPSNSNTKPNKEKSYYSSDNENETNWLDQVINS
ncbi:MAG: CdvA-like protein [Nitrososphaeraceae archaeon]|nr:CdvA-like protein [Nitrososphaeraceae archaeon]